MKGERLEDLQRVGFYDGALLRARDLGASVSYELTLHRLHTGVLHRTWGIAEGLEVRLRGEQLLVASGLAYDICGRAILLGTLAELIVPPTADGYVVAICADEVCPSPRWRAPGELRLGRDVPLARLARDGAGPWLDLAPRRYVQPFGRPRIAAGEEELALDATLLRGGWRTFPIDTATADFVETPAYFISWLSEPPLAAFVSIADVAPRSFTLQVVVPPGRAATLPARLTLSWLAVGDQHIDEGV